MDRRWQHCETHAGKLSSQCSGACDADVFKAFLVLVCHYGASHADGRGSFKRPACKEWPKVLIKNSIPDTFKAIQSNEPDTFAALQAVFADSANAPTAILFGTTGSAMTSANTVQKYYKCMSADQFETGGDV